MFFSMDANDNVFNILFIELEPLLIVILHKDKKKTEQSDRKNIFFDVVTLLAVDTLHINIMITDKKSKMWQRAEM